MKMQTVDPQRRHSLPTEQLDKVYGLQNTSEYIVALVEVCQNELMTIKDNLRTYQSTPANFARAGEFDLLGTILNLMADQAVIVADVSAGCSRVAHPLPL